MSHSAIATTAIDGVVPKQKITKRNARAACQSKTEIISIGSHYTFNDDELELLRQKGYTLRYVSLESANSYKSTIYIFNEDFSKLNEELIKKCLPIDAEGHTFYSIHTFMDVFLHKNFIAPDFCVNTFFNNNKIQPIPVPFLIIKRALDIVFALIGITGLALLLPPVAFMIKRQSPGSIFFFQKRVGLNGKEFVCTKFRTMHVTEEKHAFSKGEDDPRIFKFAHFMRRTRIDEVPQFINVLKGEMSLIGPRPEIKSWVDKFQQNIPFYNKRHLVKPGITGLAQVLYRYGANEEDAKQKLMYDLFYIEKHSAWLELKIFLKTFSTILKKKGC